MGGMVNYVPCAAQLSFSASYVQRGARMNRETRKKWPLVINFDKSTEFTAAQLWLVEPLNWINMPPSCKVTFHLYVSLFMMVTDVDSCSKNI